MADPQRPAQTIGNVLIGVTIMLLGVMIVLDRAGVITRFHYSAFWGILLIAIGLVKLSYRSETGQRQGLVGVLRRLDVVERDARVAVPRLLAAAARGDRDQRDVERAGSAAARA